MRVERDQWRGTQLAAAAGVRRPVSPGHDAEKEDEQEGGDEYGDFLWAKPRLAPVGRG